MKQNQNTTKEMVKRGEEEDWNKIKFVNSFPVKITKNWRYSILVLYLLFCYLYFLHVCQLNCNIIDSLITHDILARKQYWSVEKKKLTQFLWKKREKQHKNLRGSAMWLHPQKRATNGFTIRKIGFTTYLFYSYWKLLT